MGIWLAKKLLQQFQKVLLLELAR